MIFRARLDIGWRDLAFSAMSCALPWDRTKLEREIGGAAPETHQPFVALSVRSAFDALLQALDYPEGSEILLSAITIPDMGRIIRAHGLVPVPVDVDPVTLAPLDRALADALSPRSKALMVAHLFGARVPLGESMAFARNNGLLFLEDCAQSYEPGAYMGHPESDIAMVSFGPIKTDTALGGGVFLVRGRDLLEKMRRIREAQPLQSRGDYFKRVLKYGLLRLLAHPAPFGVFLKLCARSGRTHDEIIGKAAKGFGEGELLKKIRRRPSGPQLAVLRRRLLNPGVERLARRMRGGEEFAGSLIPEVEWPGRGAPVHTHWIFPLTVPDPDALMHHLWEEGFDATRGISSLGLMDAVPERPEIRPRQARELLSRILFVPVYPEVPAEELRRLGAVLARYFGAPR